MPEQNPQVLPPPKSAAQPIDVKALAEAIAAASKIANNVAAQPIAAALLNRAFAWVAGRVPSLAVVSYGIVSVLQFLGHVGTATGSTSSTTGQLLTTAIATGGTLGIFGKLGKFVGAFTTALKAK